MNPRTVTGALLRVPMEGMSHSGDMWMPPGVHRFAIFRHQNRSMADILRRARATAYAHTGTMHPRWEHIRSAGRRAEELARTGLVPRRIVVAAWLHDVGYGPALLDTGFHPLDGARFLRSNGWPEEVASLVAWHSAADRDAERRGLEDQLAAFAPPPQLELDMLNLIDLSTSPTGAAVTDCERIAEVIARHGPSSPTGSAKIIAREELLASSARAKAYLGLPESWPAPVETDRNRTRERAAKVKAAVAGCC